MRADQTISTGAHGIPVRGVRAEVTEGPDAGRIALPMGETLSIGTAPTNTLVLTDPTVSRFHLDLTRHENGIAVVDHGSTNGTMMQGVRIERAIVPPRSVVKLGRTSIRLDDGETVTVEAFDGEQLGGLVGRSPGMRRLMAQIERAAKSETSILLHGETGTGKEVVARAIHEASDRSKGPLETVDCGAILPSLIASELFGHEKGAFTGADQQHIGAFERANKGTLFLDEIGELPSSLQTALLGALERRSFRRVGGKQTIAVDVRVICATHRDLRREVNDGTFRQDLFYRLAVIVLSIPPLRDRADDVPLLVEHFLRESGYDGPTEEVLNESTMAQLRQYRWPGNVRELRNVVEVARVMGEPPPLSPPAGGELTAKASANGVNTLDLGDVLGMPYSEARNLIVDKFESVYIDDLLARCRGNVAQAARQAKMNRSYLTRLLKRRGLERDDRDERIG